MNYNKYEELLPEIKRSLLINSNYLYIRDKYNFKYIKVSEGDLDKVVFDYAGNSSLLDKLPENATVTGIVNYFVACTVALSMLDIYISKIKNKVFSIWMNNPDYDGLDVNYKSYSFPENSINPIEITFQESGESDNYMVYTFEVLYPNESDSTEFHLMDTEIKISTEYPSDWIHYTEVSKIIKLSELSKIQKIIETICE